MDSILTSIKKLLGLAANDTNFDEELVMHINSVLFTLTQIGVGPETGFSILDKEATWDEYLGLDLPPETEAIKLYIYLKVRLSFDPPSSSFVLESIKRQISELEFRINVQVDIAPPIVSVEEEESL